MKKKLFKLSRQSIVVLCFVMIFSSFVYASPTTDENSFADYFNISEETFYETVENTEETKDQVNDFTYIQFVQGFSKYFTPTFSQDKYLVGEGVEGVEVGILVYTLDDDGIQVQGDIIWDTLGASGLFSKTLAYEALGENHIIIAVKQKDDVIYKHFVVNRKAKETKEKLELLNINLLNTNSTDDQ